MQSRAVSSSVSLMFQKGSGVENKDLYSDALKKKRKGQEGKLKAGREVRVHHLSAGCEELLSDAAEKLCMVKDLEG